MQNLITKLSRTLDRLEPLYVVLAIGFLGIYSFQVLAEPSIELNLLLEIFSWTIYGIFAIDVLLRLLVAGPELFTWPGLFRFIRENLLSLLALLLPMFRSLRVLRVLIVLRGLAPYLKSRSSAVGTLIGVSLPLVIYTAALAIFEAERYAAGSNIQTFGDAVWWALASVTTVGYGDRFPVTADGRIIASLLMVFGIGLFSALTALLAAWVLGDRGKDTNVGTGA